MTCIAVVDSNCIHCFQDERIHGVEDIATSAIQHILSKGLIALDDKEQCLHEWLSCAAGPAALNLRDWVSEQLILGKIKLFEMPSFPDLRKKLLQLGLPRDDIKWFRLCSASNAKALVSEDSDLYHPPSKKWTHEKKEEIKNAGDGCVCKFARKEMGVTIMRLRHVEGHI